MGVALPSICTGRSMLRPYETAFMRRRFLAAFGADVNIAAELHLAHADFCLGVKSEALAVHDEADVRADFAVGPQIKRFLDDQVADAIVALNEAGDFGGGFGGGDVLFGLRGRREKSHARNVLREHGDERQSERLINIGDEFVARHVLDRAVVHQLLLEGQMPVLVALAPPHVLQAAPELMRLLDAPDFLAARKLGLG